MSLFALAFRPFFLGASLYAALVMGLWTVVYRGQPIPGATLFGPTMWWHAHAMIFGFGLAAAAGFLLTAVGNWTKKPTLRGWPLAALVATWAAARVLPHLGAPGIVAGVADLAFNVGLLVAITIPLVKAKRWRDVGTFPTKLLTLTVANALVYFGGSARRAGLYLGLYLLLALVLTIGRRVFPMFIEMGIGGVTLDRAPGLARLNLVCFVAFLVAELGWPGSVAAAALAGAVAVVNARRLWLWAHPGVWTRPLLWVLVVGYGSIVLGFALLAVGIRWPALSVAAIHALTVGGLGLTILGMMARVTLGHTGRNVRSPERPAWLVIMFAALALALLFRVALPLTGWLDYGVSVVVAQGLWIAAFALFVVRFGPMLVAPRADGKPG